MNGWVTMGLVLGGIFYAIKAVFQILFAIVLFFKEFIYWALSIDE